MLVFAADQAACTGARGPRSVGKGVRLGEQQGRSVTVCLLSPSPAPRVDVGLGCLLNTPWISPVLRGEAAGPEGQVPQARTGGSV